MAGGDARAAAAGRRARAGDHPGVGRRGREAAEAVAASARVLFPTAADFSGLVRYIEASGATEVALVNAPSDELADVLRARGVDAYTLGPPRQIELFAA